MPEGKCSFPGCERAKKYRTLCAGHKAQESRGIELVPIRERRRKGGCSILKCPNPERSSKLCQRHYASSRRNGDPVFVDRFPATLEEYFNSGYVVSLEGGCWNWLLTRNQLGYGVIPRRYLSDRFKSRYTHRVAMVMQGLMRPDESRPVDHLCRNTSCCNPSHLEVVSIRENVLRGVGPTAVNSRKTHCIRGHEFTSENTRITSAGRRNCRACRVAGGAGAQ